MTPALGLFLLVCLLGAAGVGIFGRTLPAVGLAATLVVLAAAVAVLPHLVAVGAVPDRLILGAPGSLQVTRVALGVLLAGLAALVLELVLARDWGRAVGGAAVCLVLVVPATVILVATGLIPIALGVLLMMGAIWVRWQRVAGPQLAVRSLARQTFVVFAALIAAAVVLPSAEVGSAPPLLAAMLMAAGVTGVLGVLPFGSWVGGALRLGRSDVAPWRIWVIPVGVVLGARLVASSPAREALPLQELLVALGVVSALYWSARALGGEPEGRYWRMLAADTGVMCVGVGLGSAPALGAALLLVVVHWLGGAVLGEPGGTRAQLLGWIGLSGIPPFGGFSARFLLVIAASQVSFTLSVLLVAVLGLQLAAAARAMRLGAVRDQVPRPVVSELLAMVLATATLVVGLLPVPVMLAVTGIRL